MAGDIHSGDIHFRHQHGLLLGINSRRSGKGGQSAGHHQRYCPVIHDACNRAASTSLRPLFFSFFLSSQRKLRENGEGKIRETEILAKAKVGEKLFQAFQSVIDGTRWMLRFTRAHPSRLANKLTRMKTIFKKSTSRQKAKRPKQETWRMENGCECLAIHQPTGDATQSTV
ncbi:hypothetical protein DAPPUDRAFT_109224 [Daphnia pulex]|uniref:Uncharacterized protein n=1 Tax=Daphnia pulex TaxID=6669 RepID=E9H2B6_DAPPU|nr:hypothetical protein DAPPUDRAFT_109224 [Daphnia pulex]|eukprot:EFX74145.1 hypothetical protein DAPPUDRAFT_109224 [Daphnia pulex]